MFGRNAHRRAFSQLRGDTARAAEADSNLSLSRYTCARTAFVDARAGVAPGETRDPPIIAAASRMGWTQSASILSRFILDEGA